MGNKVEEVIRKVEKVIRKIHLPLKRTLRALEVLAILASIARELMRLISKLF